MTGRTRISAFFVILTVLLLPSSGSAQKNDVAPEEICLDFGYDTAGKNSRSSLDMYTKKIFTISKLGEQPFHFRNSLRSRPVLYIPPEGVRIQLSRPASVIVLTIWAEDKAKFRIEWEDKFQNNIIVRRPKFGKSYRRKTIIILVQPSIDRLDLFSPGNEGYVESICVR